MKDFADILQLLQQQLEVLVFACQVMKQTEIKKKDNSGWNGENLRLFH